MPGHPEMTQETAYNIKPHILVDLKKAESRLSEAYVKLTKRSIEGLRLTGKRYRS